MAAEPDISHLFSKEEWQAATPEERREIHRLITAQCGIWTPLPGPQQQAYESDADIIGYGGQAGGGKSALAIGFALTKHQRVGFFRQTGTELTAIIDEIEQIVGTRNGYNSADRIWRLKISERPVQIEFGSFPDPGDERKYRGRPHDLLVFDEAQDMREEAVRFLLSWLRTTDVKQKCRALMTFNPPTKVEGRWVIEFFAPWIDHRHPNPAEPGEVRWYASSGGVEWEVEGPEPFVHDGETITPMSRTFIPSRVTDNPYLMNTGYVAQLQAIKDETLRAQLLHGDFKAGMEDDAQQVIPTSWVEAAMDRWQPRLNKGTMDSIGVDVALGGRDKTVIIRRHGTWFDEPVVYEGRQCVDGPTTAGFILAALRDEAVIHIDLFGVGSEPYGHLMKLGQQVIGVNMGEPAMGMDESGRLTFFNVRSEMWWRMREALNPTARDPICLPPDRRLLADLTAPCWELRGSRLKVDGREDLMKKVGRSPDFATACCLALMDTPKLSALRAISGEREEYDPFANI